MNALYPSAYGTSPKNRGGIHNYNVTDEKAPSPR